eukprot:15036275-Heterocapsa_arctica.AAC.1
MPSTLHIQTATHCLLMCGTCNCQLEEPSSYANCRQMFESDTRMFEFGRPRYRRRTPRKTRIVLHNIQA